MNEHPEELLAEYADGTLGASERPAVEAHVASCPVCRQEVALSRRAREALAALPDLAVPQEVEWRLRKISSKRSFWATPRAWVAAGAAAAAAAIVGVFLIVTGPGPADETGAGFGAERGGSTEEMPAPAPAEAQDATTLGAFAYPTYAETDANHDPDSLRVLARRLRQEVGPALDAGFPESGARFYRSVDLAALEEDAQTALACVTEAARPDETTVPFHVEAAAFEGDPAYLAAFLQAPSEDAAYDRIVVWVVAREGCSLLHFSFQPL